MRILSAILTASFLFACGGGTAEDAGRSEPSGPSATPTLVVTRDTCSTGVQPSPDVAVSTVASGEQISVAEVRLIEECSGLGGQWVIARDIESDRKFFLGEHGCRRLWASPPAGSYAVVRHSQTAGMFFAPTGRCIGFEGEDGVRSDQSTAGVVVFTTLADAKAFAAARGWKGR